MSIERFLLIILFIYVVYLHCKINKNKNIENFAVTDDIRAAVKEIYNTDLQAIRNLDKLADDIQKGGLKVNGDLVVTGNIRSNGEIKTFDSNNSEKASLNSVNSNTNSNSSSISSLSSTISTINTSLLSSINSINSYMPVTISFISNGSNYNHHVWEFLSESEIYLTWDNSWGPRSKIINRARSLGYALPEARVRRAAFGWDWRSSDWNCFIISVPKGKACRFFAWNKNIGENDKLYQEGLHYVNRINFSFHGVWAGLDSIKYDLIPQNYDMSDTERYL